MEQSISNPNNVVPCSLQFLLPIRHGRGPMALEDGKFVQRLQQRRKENGEIPALVSFINGACLPIGCECGAIHLLLRFQGDMDATAHSGATAHSSSTAHSGTFHTSAVASATHGFLQASNRL